MRALLSWTLAGLALLPLSFRAATGTEPPPAPSPGHSCAAAAARAERQWDLPAGLLAAIGRTESGRPDAASGRILPWPWATNAEGTGHFHASAELAIAQVRLLEARGVRSIDVGCFQVNLLYHPDAFASLEQAFDPESNAAAAARFLSDLHRRNGSWNAAVALYHSAIPAHGEPYRQRVLAAWQAKAPASAALESALGPAFAPESGAPESVPDKVTVLIAPRALLVRVVTPAGERRAPSRPAGPRLPVVITPG